MFSDIRIKNIEYIIQYSPQTMNFVAHDRKNHIIGIQLSGSAEHIFEDHHFVLRENCIYFFNQAEDYRVNVAEKGVAFSIHFTTYEPIAMRSFCVKVKEPGNIVRLLEKIEYQFGLKSMCSAKIMSDLYKLFSEFEDIYFKKYRANDARIQAAKEYMNLHFKEKDCILKAAELYGVSKRRFNDVFKENFQITPNQYIINNKISLARKLLASSVLAVSDIAELCGFSDVYYFSKTFKKETGQTPGECRNKYK